MRVFAIATLAAAAMGVRMEETEFYPDCSPDAPTNAATQLDSILYEKVMK